MFFPLLPFKEDKSWRRQPLHQGILKWVFYEVVFVDKHLSDEFRVGEDSRADAPNIFTEHLGLRRAFCLVQPIMVIVAFFDNIFGVLNWAPGKRQELAVDALFPVEHERS